MGPLAVTAKAPTLADFGTKRFLPWVRETRGLKPRSRRYYLRGWDLIKRTPLVGMTIDRINSEIIDRLKIRGVKQAEVSAAYRNQAMRTLSRALNLTVEWKVINQAPRIHLEPEDEREELITPEREERLLQHAGPTLRDVIILCQDTGGRPDEIFRIRVEDIDWQQQWIFNRHGKTKNSRRYLPIRDRVAEVLKRRAGKRTEGWLFPSDAKSGHLTTVTKAFACAREKAGLPDAVVLYSARHTFGTAVLAGTGNPAVTMKAMGHGSPKMMMRYQHPEYVEAVRRAINSRNGNNIVGGVGPTFGPSAKEGAPKGA